MLELQQAVNVVQVAAQGLGVLLLCLLQVCGQRLWKLHGRIVGGPQCHPHPTSPTLTSMTLSLQSITRAKVWLRISMSWRSSLSLTSRNTVRHCVLSLWRFRVLLRSSLASLSYTAAMSGEDMEQGLGGMWRNTLPTPPPLATPAPSGTG